MEDKRQESMRRERLGVIARNKQAEADARTDHLERQKELLAERRTVQEQISSGRIQDIQAQQGAGVISPEFAQTQIAAVEQRTTAFMESITEGQKQIEKLLGNAIINQNKFNDLVENMDDMEVHTISSRVGE